MPIEIKSSAKLVHTHFKVGIYGLPHTGKTCLVPTCPKPLILLTEETGTNSLSEKNITSIFGKPQSHAELVKWAMSADGYGMKKPEAEAYAAAAAITYDVPRIEIFEYAKVKETIAWLKTPAADAYDTIVVDSASELSSMLLKHFSKVKTASGNVNMQRAYGDAAKEVIEVFDEMLHLPKHVLFLFQATVRKNPDTQAELLAPFFEGQKLHSKIPHMLGELWQAKVGMDNDGKPRRFLQTVPDDTGGSEKHRLSILDKEEDPHMGLIFAKLRTA